jgi:uncharacterized membrane protein HdeD (DUF308 family)
MEDVTMLEKFSRQWWMFALRGLVAVVFGVVALILPEQMLQALVLMFGVFAITDGIFTVIAGFSLAPFFNRWWAVLLEGVMGTLAGLMAIFLPDITGRALLYLIAAWGLITGIFEIVAAIQFRRVITNEWMYILGGLLSILFGILLFVFPAAGAVSVIWVIGIYAFVFGIAEIIFAFRLRGLRREIETAAKSD